MTNITITLTAEELHAFEVAKYMMDCGRTDNLAMDDEMGDDYYAKAHDGLDSLEAKIQAKLVYNKTVADLKEAYPHVEIATIRKAVRDNMKNAAA